MIFDIIRDVNDRISAMTNGGMPGRSPLLIGMTDGYRVEVTFMDMPVWRSDEWEYESDDEARELARLKKHIEQGVMQHLARISSIQF